MVSRSMPPPILPSQQSWMPLRFFQSCQLTINWPTLLRVRCIYCLFFLIVDNGTLYNPERMQSPITLLFFFFSADAILSSKTEYKVNKGWTGDPCAPVNYTWVGVGCDYAGNSSKIISLWVCHGGKLISIFFIIRDIYKPHLN